MTYTVQQYWQEHADRIEDPHGVGVSGSNRNLAEIGLIDGDECYGTIDAVIFLDDDVYLAVHERVTMIGNPRSAPARLEYTYQLVVKGVPVGRWYHDPRIADPDRRFHFDDDLAGSSHLQVASHLRRRGSKVDIDRPDQHRSLKEVVDLCRTVLDNVQQEMESSAIA